LPQAWHKVVTLSPVLPLAAGGFGGIRLHSCGIVMIILPLAMMIGVSDADIMGAWPRMRNIDRDTPALPWLMSLNDLVGLRAFIGVAPQHVGHDLGRRRGSGHLLAAPRNPAAADKALCRAKTRDATQWERHSRDRQGRYAPRGGDRCPPPRINAMVDGGVLPKTLAVWMDGRVEAF
jgi:hypothetical protein